MTKFSDLPLPPALLRALDAMSFTAATPIQAAAFPIAFAGKDPIGCAETGTGKTAAFSIPMLKVLLEDRVATGLVLAPTRELAEQIAAVWRNLTRFSPEIRTALLIGGASMPGQLRQLAKKPRLVIATPGRLLDHLRQRSISLDTVRFLVLDEADRMLDMGFQPQLHEVLRFLPRERQNFLFTATWDKSLDQLAKRFTHDAEQITIGLSSQAARTVAQEFVFVSGSSKNESLLDELNHRPGSALVFTRTQIRTDKVARYLERYGVSVGRIHGGRSQAQRSSALAAFRSGKTRVLVATDIAARGIDVAEIANVINYDLPRSPEDYIHRIGRTGRNGESGVSLSFLTNEDKSTWNQILKLLKKSKSPLPVEVKPAKLMQRAEGDQPPSVLARVKASDEATKTTIAPQSPAFTSEFVEEAERLAKAEACEVLSRLEAMPDFEAEDEGDDEIISPRRVRKAPASRSTRRQFEDRGRFGNGKGRASAKSRPEKRWNRFERGLDERRFGFSAKRREEPKSRSEFGFRSEEKQRSFAGSGSGQRFQESKNWKKAERPRFRSKDRNAVPGKRSFSRKPERNPRGALPPLGIVRR